MSDLRIFSYLPNPRIWKATIAARLCGVDVEIRGASTKELPEWLWDFNARRLSTTEKSSLEHLARVGSVGLTSTLYKTDDFLQANPFGTVPAAFSPDGSIGIFESNSILRVVARLGSAVTPLYGRDVFSASRIDGFLDASLLFSRDVQTYILSLRAGSISPASYESTRQAMSTYLSGIERALRQTSAFVAGQELSIADICFFVELSLLFNEYAHHELLNVAGLQPLISPASRDQFSVAFTHFDKLRSHDAFAPDAETFLSDLISLGL
ncbi:MAG: glutathione S-transferase family protein [Stenotrophobium sp.]